MSGEEDRRSSPRVGADFILRFQTVDQLALAYGTEISTGGMFLVTSQPTPVGGHLRLVLELPETQTTIAIDARVMYVRSAAEADALGLPPGMGVRFRDLDAATRGQIEGFVAERIGGQEGGQTSPVPREGMSVLVVEDDPTYQQMIAAAFNKDDMVRFATNGFEALALCGREIPDVIVSDVNMPRMDGWQLLRLLRSKPQFARVPLLFTTTLRDEADRLRGYRLGVDDYLAKPFRVAELRARVDRLIARVGSPRLAPPPAVPAPGRSLRGDLAHVSLASVLGLLELERRTGRVTVKAHRSGVVTLREGLLVDAALGDGEARGRDALFAMLGLAAGEFEFALMEVADDAPLAASLSHLLIEHARMTDELAGTPP